MSLAEGTRLGPYEIAAQIGAGGMGEVYRATDTRLDRTVAIKVLPEHLADDPQRRERFEREARAVSSLNHPHICVLHDVGEQDGIHFLVMELVDGDTLQQRLEKGRLPLDQALEYAIQIADALDKAHRQGVVHRDLKPGNIMITKSAGVKLLDFGLAKLRVKPVSTPRSQWSTLDAKERLTAEHTLVGTPAYMAPEQLSGEDADARTDIWAFGCVLYEMLTGQRPFQGPGLSALMAAILGDVPPKVSKLEPSSSTNLDRVVETSLNKDPADRWQTAHDLMLQLKWVREEESQVGLPESSGSKSRERFAWAFATIAALSFLIASVPATRYFLDDGLSPPMGRFLVTTPTPPVGWAEVLTVSPDGRHVAYLAPAQVGNMIQVLWILPLDSTASPRSLPETESAFDPFWSPDSQSIGFVSGRTLKTIDIEGGPPQVLTDLSGGGFHGGTWNSEGVIVFSMDGRLYRVSADGDETTPLPLDESPPEISERFPQFLPDGDHLLYVGWSDQAEDRAIYVRSSDSPRKSRLLAVESRVAYSPSGHLLFEREGTLFAQPFDTERLEIAPEPVLIAEDIPFGYGRSAFAVSQNGVLVYRSGANASSRGVVGAAADKLVWFDRNGSQLGSAGEIGTYLSSVELSPDGKRLSVVNFQTGQIEVLLFSTNVMSPFTFDGRSGFSPVWSRGGEWIAFASRGDGDIYDLYQKRSSGAGVEQLLLGGGGDKYPSDFSVDGGLVFFWMKEETNVFENHSWILPPNGDDPVPLEGVGYHPKLSPNGKWIAYTAYTEFEGATGTTGVFVRAMDPDGGMWQVANGGMFPRWRGDGQELFYVTQGDSQLMAVDVTTDGTFEHGVQTPLFPTPIQTELLFNGFNHNYDVTPDGERFILPVPESPRPITVVTNWPELIENQ